MIKFIKSVMVKLYKIIAGLLPVNKKIIVFESNLFRNYTGNPRYIYETIVQRNIDTKYKCVWFFKNPDSVNTSVIPGNAECVQYKTLKFYYYMSVAGFVVSDSRLPNYLVKNKNTTYIQTWHGTPLKKLALDMTSLDMAGSNNIEKYHNNFRISSSKWDYLISQNNFSTNIFKRCFAFDKTILEIGYPRNDVLINSSEEDIVATKKKMGLPLDKKIILYAPTWRDNQYYKKGEYKFASTIDFDALRDAVSDEYVMIVKYHYLIKDNVDWSKYEGFIYQYGETEDIASLYLVSDVLITDYSSVMFDYSVLKRPMIFFTYDLDEYKNTLRGFYFDFLEEAPGPVVLDNDALIDSIRNYNFEDWKEKYEAFHNKYNHCDDGKAGEKVVELIQKLS